MNPDSPGRVATRLLAGAAIGLTAAAALAAPAAAQEDGQPFLHGDVTVTGVTPGTTAVATPTFFQEDDLPADTAAIVVEFGDSIPRRAANLPAGDVVADYDNCFDPSSAVIDGTVCLITDFVNQPGTALTLSGPVSYTVSSAAPGPIDVCDCTYKVHTVDSATFAERYGDWTWDPESEQLLGLTTAASWTEPEDPAAAAQAGHIAVVTSQKLYDLQVGNGGVYTGGTLTYTNRGPATGFDMSLDDRGSYVIRARIPDGMELQGVSDAYGVFDCVDESELAAEYANATDTLLDRFDVVCYVDTVDVSSVMPFSIDVETVAGSGVQGGVEIAPAHDSPYLDTLDSNLANNYVEFHNPLPPLEPAYQDYSGDGVDDLVAVRKSDGALVLYRGTTAGTLGTASTMATGWGHMDVAMAGDVNQDGHADLVARDTRTGSLYTYPGNGNGGLGTRIAAGSGWNKMGVFTTLDDDGDWVPDLIATRESTGGLYVYHGNGDGTFGAPETYLNAGWNYVDLLVNLGDIDGDTWEDIMYRVGSTQEFFVYPSASGEEIALDHSLGDANWDRDYSQITPLGDLNQDGYQELALVDSRTGALYRKTVYESGYMSDGQSIGSGWGKMRLAGLVSDRTYDLDEDGGTDVVARRNSDDTAYIYFGNGTGGFTESWSWGDFGGVNLLETAGDIDGDGLADVLARITSTGELYVVPGQGFGGYDDPYKIGSGWNAMSAIVSGHDFSGDGRVDVLAREKSTGTLWMFPGRGDGALGAKVKIGTGWNSFKEITSPGDLDHDGIADVIAVRNSDNCMYFYGGKAGGGVKNGVKVGCGWGGMNAVTAVGDFNGDGHADLVARRKSDGYLFLYPGDGRGDLTSATRIGTGWNGMDLIA
ncbi:FG-GAP repeat domain-containing protein [Glycomyces terrestris]|uniref:VCBS repeat-containing protein n=1 Tax=Glycomyces terrestris TaxID=2493553 RepID=A0A426UXD6_9ACTN|nr:VCBS repeat-containing protein [Glycomyces terrestris]RRR99289.1 VCBS repeat-containing protein [Glycomyces terrestris]